MRCKRSKFPDGQTPNRVKNRRERTKQMMLLRDAYEFLLSKGWTPKTPLPKEELKPRPKQEVTASPPPAKEKEIQWSCSKAIDHIIAIKKRYLSQYGFRSFRSIANDFKVYLEESGRGKAPMESISRRDITEYLRHVLETKGLNGAKASTRTRNNYLRDLHGLFEKMIEEEILVRNPCKGIATLRETVNRHLSYTSEHIKLMGEWMVENEPYLKDFSYFIGYGFLRPSEIIRLQVKDVSPNAIHLKGTKAKTKVTETIPVIGKLKPVVERLLSQATEPEHYLFSAKQEPGLKPIGGSQYFSKRFARCKDYMNEVHQAGFTKDHTLYALRHTFIRDIYLHFKQTMTREEAEYRTMQITRHKTVSALRAYIRDFSIDLPQDWSSAYSLEY